MRLTVTTFNDDLFTLEVPSDIEVENLKAYCEVETGIPVDRINLLWNGTPLSDTKKTMAQYGIADGDMLFLQQSQGAPQNTQSRTHHPAVDFSQIRVPGSSNQGAASTLPGQTDPNTLREMLLSRPQEIGLLKQRNPTLAEALLSGDKERFARVFIEQATEKRRKDEERMQLLTGDPFDPEIQRKIAEAIQQENVNANMEAAMEFSPESFGQVHMLYIRCKVNGHDVKAFVDSGAQMTIMSKACADRCNISRLMDTRWAGLAKGVGVQRILGRVHICPIQIGNVHLQCSFSILEDQPMDMLLGLDMLKRHQCCIDLRGSVLIVNGSAQIETPFLTEAELPEYARLNRAPTEDDRAMLESLMPSSPAAASSSQAQSSTTSEQFPESSILKITSNGFDRQQAVAALQATNGNVDNALVQLLAATIKLPSSK